MYSRKFLQSQSGRVDYFEPADSFRKMPQKSACGSTFGRQSFCSCKCPTWFCNALVYCGLLFDRAISCDFKSQSNINKAFPCNKSRSIHTYRLSINASKCSNKVCRYFPICQTENPNHCQLFLLRCHVLKTRSITILQTLVGRNASRQNTVPTYHTIPKEWFVGWKRVATLKQRSCLLGGFLSTSGETLYREQTQPLAKR